MLKLRLSTTTPKKTELFQMTRIPPEAPTEGMKSNLSKRRGANFLIRERSKVSLFVSWRQITELALSSTLSRTASHNLEELIFSLRMQQLMQNNIRCEDIGLEYLQSIRRVKVDLTVTTPMRMTWRERRQHWGTQFKSTPTAPHSKFNTVVKMIWRGTYLAPTSAWRYAQGFNVSSLSC